MTDEDTLRALIVQAVSNGFDHPLYLSIIDRMMNDGDHPPIAVLGILLMHREFTRAAWAHDPEVGEGHSPEYRSAHPSYCAGDDVEYWKYCTQVAAASDDPFGYVRGTLV